MTTGDAVLARLAQYDAKRDSTGAWRFNSPFRPGANSHSCSLTLDGDGEHGAWQDFNGGDKGSLYELAQRLGVPVQGKERAKVEDSKRAYKNLAEYAALKGVPEDVFLTAKWSKEPVTYDNRPAFSFPTQGGTRYRFADGNKPAFKSQTRYRACWYGLTRALQLAAEQKTALVICNGEPSTIVGLHFRVPACCITGGEQPTIPAPLLDELKAAWAGEIWLALDCDEAGRKAAAGKANLLRAAGFTVKVLDLNLSEKGDLADHCKLHTDTSLDALKVIAQNAPQSNENGSNSNAAPELAQLLKELAAARRTNVVDSLPTLLDKIQAEVDLSRKTAAPSPVQSFSSLVQTRHLRLEAARKNPSTVQGLRSGIEKLDNLIGGFVPGRVHTFYADTGMGKSTTVASIVANFAGQGAGMIIPTESMPGDYLDKLAAYKANVPFDLIETGTLADQQYHTVLAAYSWLEEKNCHILDSQHPTSSQIATEIRHGMKAYNYQWVLIDSINNLSSVVHDDLYGITSEAADLAQEIARLGLAVIITSQVGRNLKDRKNKIPGLNDALGSGRVEQNADAVVVLYRHEYYVDRDEAKPNSAFPPGLMFTRCLKHRWRGSAVNRSAFLTFKGGVGVYD